MDADELYRLAPEDFTAARDAAAKQAKADGDKQGAAQLKGLRRPSVSAWLVNRLAAGRPELLDELLALGPELAAAQSGGDAAALRALSAQRRRLVDAVVVTTVGDTGRAVSAAVRDEVASTLEAALSDPASAEAVRSGRLVRALSYAGFGAVDLSDAVAPATTAPAAKAAPGKEKGAKRNAAVEERRAERIAMAEQAANDAAGCLDDAVRACEQVERERAAAESEVQERAAEVDRLTTALSHAQQAREQIATSAHAAREASERAVAKVRRAQDAAQTARAELDRLRRG